MDSLSDGPRVHVDFSIVYTMTERVAGICSKWAFTLMSLPESFAVQHAIFYWLAESRVSGYIGTYLYFPQVYWLAAVGIPLRILTGCSGDFPKDIDWLQWGFPKDIDWLQWGFPQGYWLAVVGIPLGILTGCSGDSPKDIDWLQWGFPWGCSPLGPLMSAPVGRWFPPGAPVSSTRKLISSSFHRLDMTLAVAEALNPNRPNLPPEVVVF